MTKLELAQMMDHTLLDPKATPSDVATLVQEGLRLHVGAICVNSGYVRWAKEQLTPGVAMHLAATVGFPLGQASAQAKIAEATEAVHDGADEIDMVWNLGLFLGGAEASVAGEITAIKSALGPHVALKVILETGWLTPLLVERGTKLAVEAGADMVKTSTGFGAPGASVDAVTIMRRVAPSHVGVKASGGIRTLAQAKSMIEAGATRLGVSRSASILDEWVDA